VVVAIQNISPIRSGEKADASARVLAHAELELAVLDIGPVGGGGGEGDLLGENGQCWKNDEAHGGAF
jgi:hypothetical protein